MQMSPPPISRLLLLPLWVLMLGLCAAASAGCAAVAPVTAKGLTLKKVVIYRNGVGYFERSGRVDSDRVQFKVRRNEVGDFLASLAVLERGGSSVRSASFPLSVDGDKPAPPIPLPARDGDSDGMAAPKNGSPGRSSQLETVVMELDGKEHDLQVGYIAATPVWRPSYRLVVDGGGPEASLQAWGIVHNLSGEDWRGVSLSLIAEAPLAFDASLAVPVVPARPTVTDGGDVIAVVPQSETSLAQAPPPPPSAAPPQESDNAPKPSPVQSLRPPSAAPAPERRSKAAPSARAGVSSLSPMLGAEMGGVAAPAYSGRSTNLSALAAVALQAGATRYEIPVPITIPDKSATMVLLLDKRIPGEAVSLFAPDSGVPDSAAHPFRVARFTNKTGGLLERGPLAIFSDGAFLGQGMVDPLPDGATATVPFALERTLAVDKEREHREEGARLTHIEAGMLTISRDAVILTKYRLRNGADRAAKLLIKHPRVQGARLEKPPAGTEDNVGTGSALVPVALAARATVNLAVDERQQSVRTIDWLSPLADEAVKAYLGDRRADTAVSVPLGAAWEIRKTLVRATEQRNLLGSEEADRRRATEETRANLKALEKNKAAGDLRAKLTARLGTDSARLDEIGKRLVEVDLTINEQRVRFQDAIRAIKLLSPLPVT